MTIQPFSKYIFWSYEAGVDLPDNLVIRQVVAYGEFSDIRLLFKMVSHHVIKQALESWAERSRYMKRINLVNKVFLDEVLPG